MTLKASSFAIALEPWFPFLHLPPSNGFTGRRNCRITTDFPPTKLSALRLPADPTRALRIPLTADGDEALLLEMRERLFVWHLGGGRTIELVGRYPGEASDRLTPLSEPSFRGRSLGARVVWITDIRVEDGKAWFRVGPDAPVTALEEWRRSHVGKRLGD